MRLSNKEVERRIRDAIHIESRDFLDELLNYKPEPLTDEDYEFIRKVNAQLKNKHSLFSRIKQLKNKIVKN